MTETRHSPAVRFLPSLTDVAFLMPIVFLFAKLEGAKTLLGDGDTGWHIRTGEWILAHRAVPQADMFSFTRPGAPWYAWEWLSEVILAVIHRYAGLAGIVLAGALLISLTFALLFRLVARKSGNVIVAIIVTLVAVAGSSIHWLARPHLFTLLFAAVFLTVIERAREGSIQRLALLPLLTLVWTQLHGGFFCGILILLAYAGGEVVNGLVAATGEQRAKAFARCQPYFKTLAACSLMTFANPYGFKLHQHIYEYLTDNFQFTHVLELLSISFQHPIARFFEPMILVGMAAAFWHARARRFEYVFLLGGWAHLGLMSARNIPIYLVVAAPVVALALREWIESLREAEVAPWICRAAGRFQLKAEDVASVDLLPRLHLASVAGLAVMGVILFAPNPPNKFKAEYDLKKYPAAALQALRKAGLSQRIFTHDEWGDYLIYKLYPEIRVFVDGRSDFYGAKFDQKYLDVMNVKYDWEQTLGEYGIDTILLPVEAPLAGALKQSPRWRAAYDDQIAIVFRAVAPAAGPVPALEGGAVNQITRGERPRRRAAGPASL